MKLKSPSAASKKSTRNRWRRFSQVARVCGERPCAAILLSSILLLGACNQVPNTPPSQVNEMKAVQSETLRIQTPSAGWKLKTLSVHATEGSYLCVSQLIPPPGMAASVISNVELSVTLNEPGPPRPFNHYVLGKTWNWDSNPEVTFIDSLDEIKDALADARSVPFTTP